ALAGLTGRTKVTERLTRAAPEDPSARKAPGDNSRPEKARDDRPPRSRSRAEPGHARARLDCLNSSSSGRMGPAGMALKPVPWSRAESQRAVHDLPSEAKPQ